mmetsp:Transcript_5041/g.9502  ORF Transcript_5041/g.9502 Transcript_5041/m.9502 type:complete len:284 (+) Transcript_5041:1053-1904(+)
MKLAQQFPLLLLYLQVDGTNSYPKINAVSHFLRRVTFQRRAPLISWNSCKIQSKKTTRTSLNRISLPQFLRLIQKETTKKKRPQKGKRRQKRRKALESALLPGKRIKIPKPPRLKQTMSKARETQKLKRPKTLKARKMRNLQQKRPLATRSHPPAEKKVPRGARKRRNPPKRERRTKSKRRLWKLKTPQEIKHTKKKKARKKIKKKCTLLQPPVQPSLNVTKRSQIPKSSALLSELRRWRLPWTQLILTMPKLTSTSRTLSSKQEYTTWRTSGPCKMMQRQCL